MTARHSRRLDPALLASLASSAGSVLAGLAIASVARRDPAWVAAALSFGAGSLLGPYVVHLIGRWR